MHTVLVVEDDPAIGRALVINLSARGYRTLHESTGVGALEAVSRGSVDGVLLDLGLPDIDGLTVIDGIRGWSNVPIIVVTARHEVESKIEALDRGADDYVTKPFALGEVLARLRAALRRGAAEDDAEPVVTTADGRIVIDLAQSTVTVSGERIKVTPHEWQIISHMARHADQLVTHEDLLRAVWGPGYERSSSYLRVYISQIRHKLEADASKPQHFLTELGMGYRFAL